MIDSDKKMDAATKMYNEREPLNEECQHTNTRYVKPFPGARDEPAYAGGYECLDCGAWIEDTDDEATKRGI